MEKHFEAAVILIVMVTYLNLKVLFNSERLLII